MLIDSGNIKTIITPRKTAKVAPFILSSLVPNAALLINRNTKATEVTKRNTDRLFTSSALRAIPLIRNCKEAIPVNIINAKTISKMRHERIPKKTFPGLAKIDKYLMYSLFLKVKAPGYDEQTTYNKKIPRVIQTSASRPIKGILPYFGFI